MTPGAATLHRARDPAAGESRPVSPGHDTDDDERRDRRAPGSQHPPGGLDETKPDRPGRDSEQQNRHTQREGQPSGAGRQSEWRGQAPKRLGGGRRSHPPYPTA